MGGRSVGMIANEPLFLAGALDNFPLIRLQDLLDSVIHLIFL